MPFNSIVTYNFLNNYKYDYNSFFFNVSGKSLLKAKLKYLLDFMFAYNKLKNSNRLKKNYRFILRRIKRNRYIIKNRYKLKKYSIFSTILNLENPTYFAKYKHFFVKLKNKIKLKKIIEFKKNKKKK